MRARALKQTGDSQVHLIVAIATRFAALVSSVRRVSEYSSSSIDLEDHPYLEIGVRIGTSYP